MHQIKSEHKQFITQTIGHQPFHIISLPGDASLRTYHRVIAENQSWILMLSPPEEKTQAFIDIARTWQHKGIKVPKIHAYASQLGSALISDFGDTLLLPALNEDTVTSYYQQAMQALIPIQKSDDYTYPLYSWDFAKLEMDYFKEWFLQKLLGIESTDKIEKMLTHVWQILLANFTQQTQVVVHRDYHSRNLMLLPDEQLGIIDFQDAMQGPITYDLVSLIKDCYIRWDASQIEQWITYYYDLLKQNRTHLPVDLTQFQQDVHFVGLQRHIKVIGIFSRLHLRDNKQQYIQHIPRIMQYVLEITRNHGELFAFHQWLENEIVPAFDQFYLKFQQQYESIKVA